jgi:hypothetical protein
MRVEFSAAHGSEEPDGVAALAPFEVAMTNASDIATALEHARALVPLRDVDQAVAWLVNHGIDLDVLSKSRPREYAELHSTEALSALPIEHEIAWAGALIRHHSGLVNGHVETVRRFTKALLYGDLQAADSILQASATDRGFSTWLIESTFLLFKKSPEGLKEQKLYRSDVLQRRGRQDAFNVAISFLSERNEYVVSSRLFVERSDKTLAGWPASLDDLKSYMRYLLHGKVPTTADEVGSVLRYSALSSVVDLYEAFIDCAIAALTSQRPEILQSFASEMQSCACSIADHRLAKFMYYRTQNVRWLEGLEGANHTVSDWLLTARREIAPAHVLPETVDDGGLFLALLRAILDPRPEISEEALVLVGQLPMEGILSQALTYMSEVVRAPDNHDMVAAVEGIILNGSTRSYAPAIAQMLGEFTTSSPSASQEDLVRDFIASPHVDARHTIVLKDRMMYARQIERYYGDSATFLAEGYRAGTTSAASVASLDPVAVDELSLDGAVDRNDYPVIEDLAEELVQSPSPRLRRRASRAYARALLAQDKLEAALHVIVTSALSDSSSQRMMPVAEAVEALSPAERTILASNIDVVIIFDLYIRSTSMELGHLRRHAYEDFLATRGVRKPADLRGRHGDIAYDRLIYFLRYICISEVMQMSLAFRSTRDVEDQRIEVLGFLAEIDAPNAAAYQAESNELLLRQTIRSGIRIAETSKIDIDQNAISQWARLNLEEGFERFKALRQTKVQGPAADTPPVTAVSNPEGSAGELFSIPEDEASAIFYTIYRQLMYECAADPKRGLERFLSLRIRHGTLSGQLREPLVANHLITTRTGGGIDYEPNKYWRERLVSLSNPDRDRLDVTLARFSKAYDDFVDHIGNDLVQVRSVEHPDGFFAFEKWLAPSAAREFERRAKAATTFDDFLLLFYKLFWDAVGSSLVEARRVVGNELKARATAMLHGLDDEVTRLRLPGDVSELKNAIVAARTAVMYALDGVAEWLQRSTSLDEPSFTLEQLIEIGYEMVRKIHTEFTPRRVDFIVNSYGRLKLGLKPFSDIFFNIFENIRKHSGDRAEPKLWLHAEDNGSRISVTVSNETGQQRDWVNAQAMVERSRRLIEEGAYHEGMSREGGTGLLKIHRILTERSAHEAEFRFGYTTNCERFVVHFTIDWPARE